MYSFIIHAFSYQENVYEIKYNEKKLPLGDMLNKTIETDEEYLEMDLLFDKKTFRYRIQLCEDFENKIIFDLVKSKNKRYNVELLTENYHSIDIDSDITLQKGKETISLFLPENELGIGKIIILNTDLNFKISLKDIISKKIKRNSDFTNLKNIKKLSDEEMNFNLLRKKTKNKVNFFISYRDIPFDINTKDIEGKELRFCLHIFKSNYILTIHNMEEKDENIDIEDINIDELEKLEKIIFDKINILKNEVKTLKLNTSFYKLLL